MIIEMIADDDPARETEPTDPGDFGFYHPVEYLKQVIQVLRLSNYTFWPRAGGLDNQDASLIRDVSTWLRLEARLKWEYTRKQWREDDEKQPGYDPMQQPH